MSVHGGLRKFSVDGCKRFSVRPISDLKRISSVSMMVLERAAFWVGNPMILREILRKELLPSGSLASSGTVPDPESKTDELRLKVETCLSEMASGDENALRSLYDQIGGRVYGYLRNTLDNEADANEVLQEVFTEVWKKADCFSERRGSGISWIFAIARNRSIDSMRKSGRARRKLERYQENTSEAEVTPSSDSLPSDDVSRAEKFQELENCLSNLSPESREVIQLSFFQGLAHREIGEKLDQPLGTVKARIRRGLLSLRRSMPVEGGSHE